MQNSYLDLKLLSKLFLKNVFNKIILNVKRLQMDSIE